MYKAIAANKRNTLVIMALFVGLIGAIGYIISSLYGDNSIAIWILVVALLYAVMQYFIADKLAVAAIGAKQISKNDNPRLYRIVENLSITMGLPMPKVYIINDKSPNAFSTGRDPEHAIVGATAGMLNIMDDRELTAVMAHEMSHVKDYDIRISLISFGLTSLIGFLSDITLRILFYNGRGRNNNNSLVILFGVVILILSPIIAGVIQLAISRQREYLADSNGALAIHDPEGMAEALERLKNNAKPMSKQRSASANMFIVNPLKGGFLSKLFSTHPPLDNRIKRLRENASKF